MDDHQEIFSPQTCFAAAFYELEKLRAKQELCDVVVRLEGREFHAHKVILIACCPYFEAMFLSGMTECRQRVVDLQGVHPDAFSAILGLFYTGKVTISKENVQTILSASSIFQLEDLKNACANFLAKQLAPFNCLGIKAFAEAYGCPALADQAWKHTLRKFVDVSSTEEFVQLDLARVCQLLACDHIKVTSEEQVFDAALRWIEHNRTHRVKYTAELLRLIRLPLLPLPVLVDKVKCHHLIEDDLECRNLLDDALISYHLLPERRGRIPVERTRPRCCHYDMGVLYAVGGLSSVRGNLSSVERYDPQKSTWESSKGMTTLRSRVGVAVVDRKLYAFGGYDGSSRLCTVECFDPEKDEWSMKSPMSTRRSALSIAVLGKDIYVIGGYDGNTSLSSVEIYNVPCDKWRSCAGMTTCRSAAGAAMLEGLIYVVGK
jgi:kelch-like protein 18